MFLLQLFLILIFYGVCLACKNDSAILDIIFRDYDKNKLPQENGVDVQIAMWLQDVVSVNEATGDVQLDMYLNQKWTDPRLLYENMDACSKYNITQNEIAEKFWNPSYNAIDSKTFVIHESPAKNMFVLLWPNGTIWINHRNKLTVPCTMNWSKYPFDNIKCSVIFESYIYNADKVRGSWTGFMSLRENTGGAHFLLTGSDTEVFTPRYPAGQWNELKLNLNFSRRRSWPVFQFYMPTYFIVLMAWMSMTLKRNNMSLRGLVSIASILALFLQIAIISINTPRVSYIKGIDVWMSLCLVFVVGPLVELAFVASFSDSAEQSKKDVGVKIDKIFLILYPFLFIILNIVYWAIYLN